MQTSKDDLRKTYKSLSNEEIERLIFHESSFTCDALDALKEEVHRRRLPSSWTARVNEKGCSTNALIFPQERDNGSLDISLGYGFSNNEELLDRDTQHTTKFQISYYLNDWTYSLRTGYFTTDDDEGMQDTTLKIKRKFRLNSSLKIGIGLGVKLPTYDFTGNNTDFTIYGSMVYYPKSALSIFFSEALVP